MPATLMPDLAAMGCRPLPEGDGFDGVSLSHGARHAAKRTRSMSTRRDEKSERVAEAYSTDDYGLFANVLDKDFMGGYLRADVPQTFRSIGRRKDAQELTRGHTSGTDDNRGRAYDIFQARLVPRVAEGAQYLPIATSETVYYERTYKRGWQWDLTWEAWLAAGRHLGGALRGVPSLWGLSARWTEEYLATYEYAGCYTGGPGPVATFFTAAQGNLGTGALTADNLETAIIALQTMTDPAGNVAAYTGPLTLVVPPNLRFDAANILESDAIARIATGDRLGTKNVLKNACNLEVNHFLPTLDTTNGTTAWYLFCDPSVRPALRYGYLSGYEQPEIWVRDSDVRRLDGAIGSPYDGSFLVDGVAFKLRMTFGADRVDYRGGYASTGAG